MSKPKFGCVYKRGEIWWIKYYVDGRAFYETSKSRCKSDAESLLLKRQAEALTGTHLSADVRRVRVGELLNDLLLDYELNGKDHAWAEGVVRKHLRPEFAQTTAVKLTVGAIKRYMQRRQRNRDANATINRAVSLLHRAFALGIEAGKIGVVPAFPRKLPENNVRKGFFEWEDFVAVRDNLPDEIKPVITFAYWTGCRKGEILGLRWKQVDLLNRIIRLEPGETKNKQGRTIPLSQELYEMLSMQRARRDEYWPGCPWVFFRHGKRIKDFRKAWATACAAADLVTDDGKASKLFHDLRRTGVRNLVRAGVPERVAMAISGHKTRSVFDRYNVVSERDLRDAASKVDNMAAEQKSRASSDKTVTVKNQGKEQLGRKLLN